MSQEPQSTTSEQIADRITAWSGTMTAVVLHAVVFTLWIVLNTVAPANWHYDDYPFSFLTMAVSLEAIFLSIFVLISENRQAASDRRVIELDARINRKAEQEIKEIRDDLQVIKRLLAKVVVE
jgi:CRP/FNR family transcriptional regulator, cyclic AMP receptor protein